MIPGASRFCSGMLRCGSPGLGFALGAIALIVLVRAVAGHRRSGGGRAPRGAERSPRNAPVKKIREWTESDALLAIVEDEVMHSDIPPWDGTWDGRSSGGRFRTIGGARGTD